MAPLAPGVVHVPLHALDPTVRAARAGDAVLHVLRPLPATPPATVASITDAAAPSPDARTGANGQAAAGPVPLPLLTPSQPEPAPSPSPSASFAQETALTPVPVVLARLCSAVTSLLSFPANVGAQAALGSAIEVHARRGHPSPPTQLN
jgi:hypothetical protein